MYVTKQDRINHISCCLGSGRILLQNKRAVRVMDIFSHFWIIRYYPASKHCTDWAVTTALIILMTMCQLSFLPFHKTNGFFTTCSPQQHSWQARWDRNTPPGPPKYSPWVSSVWLQFWLSDERWQKKKFKQVCVLLRVQSWNAGLE